MIDSKKIDSKGISLIRVLLCVFLFLIFGFFSGHSFISAFAFLLAVPWIFYERGKYFNSTVISLALIFPVSLSVGGTGVGVNYLFVVLALVLYARDGFIVKYSFPVLSLAIFLFIFILSWFWFSGEDINLVRRALSFLIFISIFCFIFYRFDDDTISGLKIAIVLLTVCMILDALWTFYELGGSRLGLSVKKVGSQRYGFIFLISLFIAIMWDVKKFHLRAFKSALVAFCGLGCLFSFSRSSVVGLLVCAMVYIILESRSLFKPKTLLMFGILSTAAVVAVSYWLPSAFDFYAATLFSLVEADGQTAVFNLNNPQASEGYRLWLWSLIWEYSWINPFGSGFAGVWTILDEGGSGSAHSQFFDVLFRSGLPGLVTFGLLIWVVGNALFSVHRDLFYGFLGMVVIGIFHETFKESHGAFLLAVFMSICVHYQPLGRGTVEVR